MKRFIFIIFFVSALVQTHAQNFDIQLLRDINLNRNKGNDPTYVFLSNSMAPVSIAAPLIVFGMGWHKEDAQLKIKGLIMIENLVVSGLITTGLKYSINRQRPFVTYPDIQKGMEAGSPSFPSGHTSTAFCTATSLSMAFPKWYVMVPSFAYASAVAYSRMDLGVHYPTDVFAGAVIGSGSVFLCNYLNKRLFGPRKKHLSAI